MKFMHIRRWKDTGHLGVFGLSSGTPYHIKGGITLAYLLEKKSPRVTCGIAFCSPNDRYCKRSGRAVAASRLHTQPLQISMNAEITPRIIAQVVRTFLIDPPLWTLENRLPHRGNRFSTSWESTLLGPDGVTVHISVDGEPEGVRGWVRNVPRWAQKAATEAAAGKFMSES